MAYKGLCCVCVFGKMTKIYNVGMEFYSSIVVLFLPCLVEFHPFVFIS